MVGLVDVKDSGRADIRRRRAVNICGFIVIGIYLSYILKF